MSQENEKISHRIVRHITGQQYFKVQKAIEESLNAKDLAYSQLSQELKEAKEALDRAHKVFAADCDGLGKNITELQASLSLAVEALKDKHSNSCFLKQMAQKYPNVIQCTCGTKEALSSPAIQQQVRIMEAMEKVVETASNLMNDYSLTVDSVSQQIKLRESITKLSEAQKS